ncbi:hypothetical protein [Xenophilus azovorans]|uniref:hypothetical protein n=1 Tax=Xenophilus azovorans TaxID=151755 RepID=UPI00068CBDF9|nr:hypothetical protein [Xenophilus azovorans]
MARIKTERNQCLPLFARIAVERLDADASLRKAETLDALLDAYARTYGLSCDDRTREVCHEVCASRFGCTFAGAKLVVTTANVSVMPMQNEA